MPIQHFYFHFLKRKWARPKEHDQGKNMHIQNKKKYKYEISEEEKKPYKILLDQPEFVHFQLRTTYISAQ